MPRKKSKKPFKFFTISSLRIPTNVAVGPLGFRLDIRPEGERNCSHHELGGDQPELTMILDEDNPKPSQVVFREMKSGAQEPPPPGTSIAVATHDVEQRDRLTSEPW